MWNGLSSDSKAMTTQKEYDPNFSQMPTFTQLPVVSISSDPDEDWLHPILDIFRPEKSVPSPVKPRLYLLPSTFGEEYDPEFAPEPTSSSDLPEIKQLTQRFAHNLLEIWAGKRPVQQVQSMCHYRVFAELTRKSGSLKEVGRIRKLRVTEPLDGISESTVTVRFGDRLRVIAIRFEGLDQKWLCTSLTLI